MLKVAINGAGRIGRACARLLLQRDDRQLVAIADTMPPDQLRYLLEHDSIHRNRTATPSQNCKTKIVQSKEGAIYDFAALGADVLLECSGRFLSASDHHHLIEGGLRRVILSAVAEDETPVLLKGVSPEISAPVLSAGSCTSNALALITHALAQSFKLEGVMATSIHSYTADQRLLDGRHAGQWRYSRAAGGNIIPSKTMAAANLPRILGSAHPRAAAIGLRVPLADVCLMQAVFRLGRVASKEAVNAALERFSQRLPDSFGFSCEPLVSTDVIGTPQSAIVDGDLTTCCGDLVQVCAWHDNETGYAARVVELIPSR